MNSGRNIRLNNGRSISDHSHKWWLITTAAWGAFLASMTCFLLVCLMIWKGGPWAYIIYVERPVSYFLGGVAALLLWYFLLYGMHNSPKEWKVFAAKLSLMVFSLAISLFAGELILRKYYIILQDANSMERFKAARKDGKPPPIISSHPLAAIIQPSDNQQLMYELQPNLDIDFGHNRVRTNAEGMRDDKNYNIHTTGGVFRIIGIGDSGMFGWDVEQNEDYLAVLEVNLNKRQDCKSYDVLNMGVPGYNTQLEVEILRTKGLKYKPNIVVVGWCDNDYGLPFFMLEKEDYRRRDKSFVYNLLFKRTAEKTKRTEVAPGFRITDKRDFDKDNVLPEFTSGSDRDRVKTALYDLKKLGEQHSFKVLLFGPMGKDICNICTEIGMAFSNTHVLIPRDKYPRDYIIHFMHPNEKGHAVLAEYLENDLVKRGWLAPSNK